VINDLFPVDEQPRAIIGVDEELHFTVALHAQQAELDPDPDVGDAKVRVMVGMVARWGGIARYVEVNLERSDNFDLVDATTNSRNARTRAAGSCRDG